MKDYILKGLVFNVLLSICQLTAEICVEYVFRSYTWTCYAAMSSSAVQLLPICTNVLIFTLNKHQMGIYFAFELNMR